MILTSRELKRRVVNYILFKLGLKHLIVRFFCVCSQVDFLAGEQLSNTYLCRPPPESTTSGHSHKGWLSISSGIYPSDPIGIPGMGVTHPSINRAQRCLTLVIFREPYIASTTPFSLGIATATTARHLASLVAPSFAAQSRSYHTSTTCAPRGGRIAASAGWELAREKSAHSADTKSARGSAWSTWRGRKAAATAAGQWTRKMCPLSSFPPSRTFSLPQTDTKLPVSSISTKATLPTPPQPFPPSTQSAAIRASATSSCSLATRWWATCSRPFVMRQKTRPPLTWGKEQCWFRLLKNHNLNNEPWISI